MFSYFYIINHNVFIKVLNRNLFPLVLRTGTSTVKMPGNQQNIVNFIIRRPPRFNHTWYEIDLLPQEAQ